MALRKEGFSITVSPRALINGLPGFTSFTQDGMKPQRTNAKCRAPCSMRTTPMGWPGATWARGGKSSSSWYLNQALVSRGLFARL